MYTQKLTIILLQPIFYSLSLPGGGVLPSWLAMVCTHSYHSSHKLLVCPLTIAISSTFRYCCLCVVIIRSPIHMLQCLGPFVVHNNYRYSLHESCRVYMYLFDVSAVFAVTIFRTDYDIAHPCCSAHKHNFSHACWWLN